MTSELHIFRQVIRMTLCRLLILNYFISHLNGNNIHLFKKDSSCVKVKMQKNNFVSQKPGKPIFYQPISYKLREQANVLASKCPNKHMSLQANVPTSKRLTSN